MKTTKKLAILALAITTTTSVWAQKVSDTSREIDAQTKITKGHIDNLLEKMNRQKVDTRFRANDYLDQAQESKNKVEAALKKFEGILENDVLAKASYWMDEYNSIARSADYSDEQKNILLKQRKINLDNQFALLSKTYAAAIKEVYKVVPYGDVVIKNELSIEAKSYDYQKDAKETVKIEKVLSDKERVSVSMLMSYKKHNGEDVRYVKFTNASGQWISGYNLNDEVMGWDHSKTSGGLKGNKNPYRRFSFSHAVKPLGYDEVLLKNLYDKYVYPKVKGSCKSSICIGLKSGEHTGLLVMIKSLIDRDIHLRLADGDYATIKMLGHDTKTILSLLTRVDYPEELPFDI